MIKKQIVYVGRNRSYIGDVNARINLINGELFNRENRYQFNPLSFSQLKGFICQTKSNSQEISAVILDNEFPLSEFPCETAYDRTEEEVIEQDFVHAFNGIKKLLPDTPVLVYPSCLRKTKNKPNEFEKELLKDRLFHGTSQKKYSSWAADNYRDWKIWTTNPLQALLDAQNESQEDNSRMMVLLYEDAPLVLFDYIECSGEFGLGEVWKYHSSPGLLTKLEPNLRIFSETRPTTVGSLADLVRISKKGSFPTKKSSLLELLQYSDASFKMAYLVDALRKVIKERREYRKGEKIFEQLKIAISSPETPQEIKDKLDQILSLRKPDGEVRGIIIE